MTFRVTSWALALCLAVLAVGCATEKGKGTAGGGTAEEKAKKIAENRAKLDEADRALVDAQEYCPIMQEQRLGSMGVPMKVMIKDKPVFLCCKGCKGPAEDEPDTTLKAVEEMKEKKKKGQ